MKKIEEIEEKIAKLQKELAQLNSRKELILNGIEFEYSIKEKTLRVENFLEIVYLNENDIEQLKRYLSKLKW